MSIARSGSKPSAVGGLGLIAVLLSVWLASPASAHSVLLGTSPVASGRVRSAPASVVMTFNEMPRGQYSVIHVVGPDGARRDSGHVRVLNDTITEDLGGSRPAGTYAVDWRVISADGHPVSGQFAFTATAEATALAARQPDTTGARAASKSAIGSGVVAAIVVAATVAIVVGVVAVVRRRKNPRPASAQSELDDD